MRWVKHKKQWNYMRYDTGVLAYGYVRPASKKRWAAFVLNPGTSFLGYVYLGLSRRRGDAQLLVEAAVALRGG